MTQRTFYVQAEAATDALRTAQFGGDDYLVVPVIALVEGVLHSANAENPELALADEFGRYPNAWDGRPLVMNHPQVNGDYVSANSPTILEEWSFGQLFNTRMEDGKLKTEAWIDLAKVNQLGGETASTIERIQSGDVVEVSTGLFASVEDAPGEYDGTAYAGVWRSVAPDHLAFLSEGSIGACSVADGAGVPRLNMRRYVEPKANEVTMSERSDTDRLAKANASIEGLVANSIPAGMPIDNAKMHLTDALNTNLGADDGVYTIWACTTDTVVYETWSSMSKYERSFSVAEDGTVTLGDDVREVHMMTSIVPKMNSEADAAEDATGKEPETPAAGEDDVANDPELNQGADTLDGAADTIPPQTEVQEPAPAVNSASTVEEYIAAAPAAMRDVLANSLKLHNAARAKLVEGIKANEANAFTDAQLDAMDMGMLEQLHALAAASAPAPDYSGQAGGPRANTAQTDAQGLAVNAGFADPCPEAFPTS